MALSFTLNIHFKIALVDIRHGHEITKRILNELTINIEADRAMQPSRNDMALKGNNHLYDKKNKSLVDTCFQNHPLTFYFEESLLLLSK